MMVKVAQGAGLLQDSIMKMQRGAVKPIAVLARHPNRPTFLDHAVNITYKVMYDATGVRLVAGRQVDDCYFSGVIYSMMAVVVGGV
ncbi:hypothetical protein HanXRQr2_Chr17g0827291 [Helianthus annuus]|uniref:Uncharacterized protein n=1 Tax=Helianthus annuus TaxID=4232 RepID=A0A9K3DMR2_HELAN|nr:hypothetical protein HanXRQr2_Chr17g0827291 [Helianthus annuus]KAJ0435898.1 hypothetical protein HanIR_Chr17g0898471 [Helianthus annuus]